MDKYEYKVRSEEIKALIAQKEYVEAAEIADSIDWRRVKSVMMLCTISDLYKINRRYDDSYDLLLLAYDRHPGSRTIVYALCELSVKMGKVAQAWEYYKEYMQIAPKDPGRYILQYKIYEAEEVNLEERVAVLEELKNREFRERWVYELAYLYHRIGLESKCIDECDELIAFGGDGKFVIKAMELKMLHSPLTWEQQQIYNNRFAPQEEVVETVGEQEEAAEQEPVEQTTTTWSGTHVGSAEGITEVEFADTKRIPVEEMDIQVKTVGLNPGDTINLQQEVAAGVQQFLDEKSRNEEITQTIIAPMLETDSVDSQMVESALAEAAEEVQETLQEEITETVSDAVSMNVVSEAGTSLQGESVETISQELREIEAVTELAAEEIQETVAEKAAVEMMQEQAVSTEEVTQEPVEGQNDQTATAVMEQLRQERTSEPPKELADILTMDTHGQLCMVMEEETAVEKQITGQISFSEYLLEWEQKKKEIEAKSQEKIRKIIERNTNQMFDELQAAQRDELLEQLEKGRDLDSVLAEAEGRIMDEDGVPIPTSLLESEEMTEPVATDIVDGYEENPSEETYEIVEQAEILDDRMQQESVEEEAVWQETEYPEIVAEMADAQETAEETVEEAAEEITEEIAEDSVEAVAEAVAGSREETEESLEIEYLTEEVQGTAEVSEEELFLEEAQEVSDFAAEESSFEEEISGEEPVEEVLSEIDAAYEAALMGATADVKEAKEAGIDYETISMPANEVEAVLFQESDKQRSLTREERELFGPYIQGRSSKVQLVHAIDNISMAAYTGNVIITGTEGMDTLGLAKNIIRNIQLTDSNFSGKIAKISGESLNKRDVSSVLEGLDNGALIIQKASGMSPNTADSLYKALQQEHRGIVLILEGTKKSINAFLSKNQKLQNCFTGRIDMEALSDAALVNFGHKYAREKEYSIDEFGGLALSRKIAERQSSDHAVTIQEVKEIMDEAIESANRKTIGHFFDVLLGKRYDDEDMIIIREKDFR